MPPSNLLRLAAQSTRPRTHAITPTQLRPISQTPYLLSPKKGAEDRNDINTESTEHSKSSTDADAAQQDQAAYDPSKTSPESEMESAGDGKEVCTLHMSPFCRAVWGYGQQRLRMGGMTANV